jgi:hypothetical protein
MQAACPNCGMREIRLSHRQTAGEVIRSWLGIYTLRCRRCQHRWKTNVWSVADWKYARCPQCYRQELTTLHEEYHPRLRTRFMLRLGAKPYRCPLCRCNFASFLPCRERFVWKHEER